MGTEAPETTGVNLTAQIKAAVLRRQNRLSAGINTETNTCCEASQKCFVVEVPAQFEDTDPFSANFEMDIEDLLDMQVEVMDSSEEDSLTDMGQQMSQPWSEGTPTRQRSTEVNHLNGNSTISKYRPNRSNDNMWPPLPECLDEFTKDIHKTRTSASKQQDKHRKNDKKLKKKHKKERIVDLDDVRSGSPVRAPPLQTVGRQSRTIVDGTQEKNTLTSNKATVSSDTTNHDEVEENYENVVFTRSKSEIVRSRKFAYENVDIDVINGRRHSEITSRERKGMCDNNHRHHSADILVEDREDVYENVVLRPLNPKSPAIERANNKLAPVPESVAESSAMLQVSGNYSDNPRLSTSELDTSDTQDSSLAERRSTLPDTPKNNVESDGSYYSDSEFDDDPDEVQNLEADRLSTWSFTSNSTLGRHSHDSLSRISSAPTFCADNWQEIIHQMVVELGRTERAYVDCLHFLCRMVLLNLKVLSNVQDVLQMPPDAIKHVFSNIEVIFGFHSENLLPRVEERLETWATHGRIGDIMKELVPFLKLYKDFVENFKKAMSVMDTWLQKDPVFYTLMQEVQKTPESRRLTIKQHMFNVAHRVTVYQTFLKDYVDCLPPDADDIKDAEDALKSTSETMHQLERAMGKDERMKKLRDIQSKLDSNFVVIKPTRELIKEGQIKTILPNTKRKLNRYVFLMNDVLILCTPPGLGGKHKVKVSLNVDGMQIHDGDNLEIPHTFYVQSKKKAIEFHTRIAESKEEWIQTLRKVMDDYTKWKLSGQPLPLGRQRGLEEELGKIAPTMVPGSTVQSCRLCNASFRAVRRKHHCRACGQVVCSKCATQKVRLKYDSDRLNKVCDECYVSIRNRDLTDNGNIPQKSVVTVSAMDQSARICQELDVSSDGGKTWRSMTFSVHNNGFLYSFKNEIRIFMTSSIAICAKEMFDVDTSVSTNVQSRLRYRHETHVVADVDTAAYTSLPLKRFRVGRSGPTDPVYKGYIFKVFNTRKTYFFKAEDSHDAEQWVNLLAEFVESST